MNHSCKDCGRSEPDVEFYYRKSRKNGKSYPSPYCKEHERKRARDAKRARYHNPVMGVIMKERAAARSKLPENRTKANIHLKARYRNDESFREGLKDKMRERRADPIEREKTRIRAANYYQKNKKEIQQKITVKKKSDPKLRIRGFMRGRINEAMKSVGKTKGGTPSLQYLSYSWDDLYRHLESQFENWMSFSNYGAYDPNFRTWQIDHILPQVFFPYESMDSELFRMCWDLDNLRPLESSKNFIEGNREHLLGPMRNIHDIFREVQNTPLASPFSGSLFDIYSRLSDVGPAKDSCSMRQIGLNYLDSIFLQRFSARTGKMPAFSEAVFDEKRIFRALLNMVKKEKHYSPGLVHSNLRFQVRLPGHFFPAAAASVVRTHLPLGGSIFDPFLGWGGRILGSICAGAGRVVGCDIQDDIPDNCRRVATDLSPFAVFSTEFHSMDCLKYLQETDEKFDLVFTSPPYFNTENYGVESDAMREGWIDTFVLPFAKEVRNRLQPKGRVALHLKDVEGSATFTAYHSAMRAAGFSSIMKHRYSRTWSQAIYVYELS